MPTDGKITLDNGLWTIEVAAPIFGYKSTLDLPLDVVRLDNGSYATRCEESTYDKRWCDCTLELSAAEMATLSDFLRDVNLEGSGARAEDVTLTMPADSGFFPFGPDKGDAGPFTVAVEMLDSGGVTGAPYGHFRPRLRLTNTGAFPAYTLPTQINDGPIVFGTVTACRFPQDYFQPAADYGYDATMLEDSDVEWVDRSTTADSYTVTWPWSGNESKSAAVLAYIAGTVRAASFPLIVPAGCYIFGIDKSSSGAYSVKMIRGNIEVTHTRHNEFYFEIELSHVGGP